MVKAKRQTGFITTGLITQNKRAHYDYLIHETYIAGLVLTGTEVKSLRQGHANINDAYGVIEEGEIYMANMFISAYENQGYSSHAEKRNRKLLLQHREIIKIINSLNRKGTTLIAEKMFFDKHGRVKLQIGLGVGKKLYDKRETTKERDWSREKSRLMSQSL